MSEEFEKKMQEERKRINDELKVRLADAPKLRDIEVCRKCRYFWRHEDGYCGCGNVSHNHGMPWCRESKFGVTEDVFEKVHIFIWGKEFCEFEKRTRESSSVE